MPLKARFIISLIIILLLSWADVFFAGTQVHEYIPVRWHQPVHFGALLTTMLIGYLNWKAYPQKWLAGLWLFVYGIMIALLVLAGGLYLLHAPFSLSFVRVVIYLRNRFTWPLLFLIWYMLQLMSKYMIPGKRA